MIFLLPVSLSQRYCKNVVPEDILRTMLGIDPYILKVVGKHCRDQICRYCSYSTDEDREYFAARNKPLLIEVILVDIFSQFKRFFARVLGSKPECQEVIVYALDSPTTPKPTVSRPAELPTYEEAVGQSSVSGN